MPSICPVSGKNVLYMQVCAPYMLRICKKQLRICSVYAIKMPRICSVYAKKCPVYAPYREKKARICSVYAKKGPYMLRICKKRPVYAPYMQKKARICTYMLRICSVSSSLIQWKKPIEPEPKKMRLEDILEKAKYRVQAQLTKPAFDARLQSTLQQYLKKVGATNLKVSTCLFWSGNNRYILHVVMKSFSKRCLWNKDCTFSFHPTPTENISVEVAPKVYTYFYWSGNNRYKYIYICCMLSWKKIPRSVSEIKIAHFLLRQLHPLHVVYFVMESFSKVCWWNKDWSIFPWYLVHTYISRSP